MEVCISVTKRKTFDKRYRKYAEAKSKIPLNLSPKEYEAAVKRLAKKYKI